MDTSYSLDHVSMKWVENLALEEINMDQTGVVHFTENAGTSHDIEESAIELMEEIKELFEICVARFNECRGDDHSNKAIKVFKISNTVNDFMLFRNSLKLIVARKTTDSISIGFIHNSNGFFSHSPKDGVNHQTIHEIKAQLGPFHDIKWTFRGDEIDIKALVKYYLTEFIRQSAQ